MFCGPGIPQTVNGCAFHHIHNYYLLYFKHVQVFDTQRTPQPLSDDYHRHKSLWVGHPIRYFPFIQGKTNTIKSLKPKAKVFLDLIIASTQSIAIPVEIR
jgi:hypothetical protein